MVLFPVALMMPVTLSSGTVFPVEMIKCVVNRNVSYFLFLLRHLLMSDRMYLRSLLHLMSATLTYL